MARSSFVLLGLTIRRLGEHERGEVKSTRPHRPWKLVHVEWFATRADAMKREREIKRRKKRSYIESLIRGVAQCRPRSA